MPAETPWVLRLAGTAYPERFAVLEKLVIREFRDALLMTDADDLPYDESYFALGLTSLGATDVERRLETTFGRSINSTTLLNNPTIGHLLEYLRDEVLAEFFPNVGAAAGRAPATVKVAADSTSRAFVDDMLKDLYAS